MIPDLQVEFRPGAGPFYDDTDPGALWLPGHVGAWASTPDHASLDITGDIDLRIDLTLSDWEQGDVGLIGKYDVDGNARSYLFALAGAIDGGKPWLIISSSGTASTSSIMATAAVTPGAGGRLALRVTLDVNNGAAGHTATFYTATSIAGPWSALGSPVVVGGTTSIHSGTAVLGVGSYNDGASSGQFTNLRGTVHAAQVLSGIAGTVVADVDFSGHEIGTTSITDGEGKVWTVHGDAQVTEGRDLPWVDLSGRALAAEWGYGRDNELDTFSPGTGAITLKNDDRALDPDNAAGAWYGQLDPRTPFRIRARTGHLALPGTSGNYASTTDKAQLDITGDIDIRCEATVDDWTPAADQTFVGKYVTTGNQRTYWLRLKSAGTLELLWSTAGVAALNAESTEAVAASDGDRLAVRATLDVNNGAAGRTVRFYTAPTIAGPWTQLGADVTTAGTTSIVASTAPLELGSIQNGTLNLLAGQIHAAEVRNGIAGTVVANPDLTLVAAGATSFADTVGNTWTVSGTAAIDDTVDDLFYGFVQSGFEQEYRPPAAATCRVGLVDFLGVLEGEILPSDAYGAEVLADHPAAYWRLESTIGNEMTDSSEHGNHGRFGEVELADPLVGDKGHAATFDHVGDWRGQVMTDSLPPGPPTTLEAWVQLPRDLTETHSIVVAQRDYALGSALWLRVGVAADCPNGELSLFFHGLGGSYKLRGDTRIDDDEPHHVVAVIAGTALADIHLYVDGEEESLTVVSGTSGGSFTGHRLWTVGNTVDNGHGDYGLGGVLDEVAVYRAALTAARVAAHYEAGFDGWAGEKSGARVERVLDLVGVPDSLRNIDQGDSSVGPANYDRQSAGEYLARVAESEQGALYVDHHDGGKLRFRGRYHRLTDATATAVQYPFTDEDDPAALHVEPDIDVRPNGIDSIINVVEAQWSGGTAVVRNDLSVARYGPQSRTITTEAPAASAAAGSGEWLIRRYAEPQTRVAGLTLAPDADQRLWRTALAVGISDRVSLRRHPQQVGSAVTNELHAEGIHHSVADGVSWRVRLNLSHAEPPDAAWIWGTSAWGETTTWG